MANRNFSAVFVPAWKRTAKPPARAPVSAPSPVVAFLGEIDAALGEGDAAQLAGRMTEAIASWRAARAKILHLLLPAVDESLASEAAELPVGPEIEQQMAQAVLGVIEALQNALNPSPPLVTPPVMPLPPRLARLSGVGFRAAANAPSVVHGGGGGVAAIAAAPAAAAAAPGTTWSVGVRRGTALASLTWRDGVRPDAAALLDAVYEPRRSAEDAPALMAPITHLAELAAQLPYLYSYALPRRIADAHHQLGEFALADALYRASAQFGFLNHELEGASLWACIASNIVAWGDALYRAEDLDGCRERYAQVLTSQRAEPVGAFLYTDPALAAGAASARRVIAALDAPPADVDPSIAMPILRAAMRWEYLDAGLDYYGTDFTPVFTFAFLQEAARQFATRSVQAERDYIQFQSQAESEAASRRELEAALAAARAERDGRAEQLSAARREHEAMAASAALARLRAQQAQQDRDNYAVAGRWQYTAQSIAAAHGAGADWYGKEIRELAADMEAGSWEGEYGKLAAAATLLGGRKSYEYQLARMDMTIAETQAAIPIADAQAAAAASRERAAAIALNAATQGVAFAAGAIAAFDAEVFTPQTWAAMAAFMRDIAGSYLEWAIRTAKLMERAYNFETDAEVRVVRNEYAPAATGGLLGADALSRDIESFTYLDIVGVRTKETQIKDSISLANEYPFAFAEFLRTGRMSFETALHDFDHRHPGAYGQRVTAVELEVIGLLPEEGVHGTVRAGGVSRFRTRDGGFKSRCHVVDTMVLSEYASRNDGFLYRTDARKNALFEGMGPATTWLLELPRRSNNFDYRLITDVRLVLYYTARFDAALNSAVLSREPLPGELVHARSFVLRYDFPEVWYPLLDTGAAPLVIGAAHLPRNETAFAVDDLAIQVVTRPGSTPADLRVSLRAPAGAELAVPLDQNGLASAAEGQPLAALIGAPLLGDWRVTLTDSGGSPVGDSAVEDVLLLVQYRFAWPE